MAWPLIACCADSRLMARDGGRIGITELLVGLPFPALAFEVMRFVAMPPDLPALLYTGETFPPPDALDRGLIDEIVEPSALLDRAVEKAQRLAALPPQAFAVTNAASRIARFIVCSVAFQCIGVVPATLSGFDYALGWFTSLLASAHEPRASDGGICARYAAFSA